MLALARTSLRLVIVASLLPLAARAQEATVRIVNGQSATGREPWAKSVAALATRKDGKVYVFCTGTLIAARTILTAAHCIDESKSGEFAVFGLGETSFQTRRIERTLVHPAYDAGSDGADINDLALVFLASDPPDGFAPIERWTAHVRRGQVLVAGYGVTNGDSQKGAGALRFTSVAIANANYGKTESSTDESERGTCNGDSGGPAYVKSKGHYFLWGVTSRGDTSCREEGIYTRVGAFRDWLESTP